MTIKPPSGIGSTPILPSVEGASKVAPKTTASVSATPLINPEAVAKALKDLQILRGKLKKPLMSGAASLFTDHVTFPADLLDPNNPANDPKYLHLLCAVLGMKDLEPFLATPEQWEEEEDDADPENDDEGDDAA